MAEKYSCVASNRADQLSADFYLKQFNKLHTDPFDAKKKKTKKGKGRDSRQTGGNDSSMKMHKSAISEAAPNFFRTHPSLQLKPQDYSRKVPLADAFHRETHEFLHPDGRRRHLKLQIGGMEDSAVSRDAPAWFQVGHVTTAPLREKVTAFSPFWKPPAKAQPAAAVSEAGPDWMKLKGLPVKGHGPSGLGGAAKAPSVWDPSWQKEPGRIDQDRDSAVSNDAPEWFRVHNVPVCRRGGARGTGLLTFSYDTGSGVHASRGGSGKKRPATSGTRAQTRQRPGTRSSRPASSVIGRRARPSESQRRRNTPVNTSGKSRITKATPGLNTANDYYRAINQLQDQQLNAARARLAQLRKPSSNAGPP